MNVTHDSWPLFSSNQGRKEPDYPSATRKWIISVNRIPRPRTISRYSGRKLSYLHDGRSIVDLKKIIQPILFSRRSTVRRRNLLFFSHVIMLQLIDGNLWMCIHEKEEGTRDFFAFKTTDNVTKRDFWRGIESLN